MILRRLTGITNKQQPIEQAGFSAGFSTVEHMHVLKQLVTRKMTRVGTTKHYISFVDNSKAFDSVRHDSFWKTLTEQKSQNTYA